MLLLLLEGTCAVLHTSMDWFCTPCSDFLSSHSAICIQLCCMYMPRSMAPCQTCMSIRVCLLSHISEMASWSEGQARRSKRGHPVLIMKYNRLHLYIKCFVFGFLPTGCLWCVTDHTLWLKFIRRIEAGSLRTTFPFDTQRANHEYNCDIAA